MELKIDRPIFIAVITNKFLANSIRFLKICESVEESNIQATLNDKTNDIKPMYAIIKQGVDWHDFEKFSWRKIWFFDTEQEFDRVWDEMQGDVRFWNMIANLSNQVMRK